MLAFCAYVSMMRLLGRAEVAERAQLPVNPQLSDPAARPLVPTNSQEAGFVGNSGSCLVLGVDKLACFSQVHKTIVGSIPVDVVNLKARPMTVRVQPRETVCAVSMPANSQENVSVGVNTASGLASLEPSMSPHVYPARKHAGKRVEIKQGSELFRSQVMFSHGPFYLSQMPQEHSAFADSLTYSQAMR